MNAVNPAAVKLAKVIKNLDDNQSMFRLTVITGGCKNRGPISFCNTSHTDLTDCYSKEDMKFFQDEQSKSNSSQTKRKNAIDSSTMDYVKKFAKYNLKLGSPSIFKNEYMGFFLDDTKSVKCVHHYFIYTGLGLSVGIGNNSGQQFYAQCYDHMTSVAVVEMTNGEIIVSTSAENNFRSCCTGGAGS